MPAPRPFRLVHAGVLLALAFSAARPAVAGDPSFGSFVRRLESEYSLRRTHIPFVWLAQAVVWVARPAGVSRLDIAIFENQDLSPLARAADLQSRVHAFLGLGWRPFVEVHAPRRAERVLLYARQTGRDMEMFILCVEKDQALALLTRVNPEALHRAIEDPHSIARVFR